MTYIKFGSLDSVWDGEHTGVGFVEISKTIATQARFSFGTIQSYRLYKFWLFVVASSMLKLNVIFFGPVSLYEHPNFVCDIKMYGMPVVDQIY